MNGKKSESVTEFLLALEHIASFSTDTEMEKLTLVEQVLVKVIRNKNASLSFKTEILEEYRKVNERQLTNLGNAIKSRFPNQR
jgi:predicted house-cleaning noncanonical NTP pyrophosphatase (MazG superfamily)